MAFASHVDLDPEVFGACMVSGGGAERVQRDLEDADRLDVRSIPSVFINGVRLEGLRDYSVYRSAIEAELARQR
jgi:predicted DsbA family dithiol-disulfide isomerase